MKKYLCFLLIIVLLTGCGNDITGGEICEKTFKSEYFSTILMPISHFNGKTTTITYVPYIYHYPDRWIITIKAYDETKDKWRTKSFYVAEDIYNQYEIGDTFTYDATRGDLAEEPYTKEKQ